jgi:pimeloyl-ACP methyl ester carboxylesterase
VAATLAATRPDLVRRLVLAAGWAGPEDEYIRSMMRTWLDIADNPAAFGRYGTITGFGRGFLNLIGPEEVDRLSGNTRPTPGILRQLDLNLRVDVRPLLPRVTAATLVIGCAQDATIPVGNARALHAAIEGSAYAEIDGGHVVVLEKAEEFTEVVREFLDAA